MSRPRFKVKEANRPASQREPRSESPSYAARGWGRREWALSALLACVTLIAFSPVLECGFVDFDDGEYVSENVYVQAGLSARGFAWAWTTAAAANWHPLTWLSLMLDAQVFGSSPTGFHLTNLLLHVANTLLLFAVLRYATGAVWPSAFTAGLFALHPLRVESVAWIAERKDVLSIFFGLIAIGIYIRYSVAPTWGRYFLVLLCTALSLLAKPMLVTLPLVLLLLDFWPLGRWRPEERSHGSIRLLLLEKLPFVGLSLASCVITLWAQNQGGSVGSLKLYSLQARVANALTTYLEYLRQTALPTDLAAFYPHPRESLGFAAAASAGAVLLLVTTAAVFWRRAHPYVLMGWLWYLATLAPVIGLIQVGGQARADRYTYFPLIGVYIVISWGAADLARSWRCERLAGVVAALVLFSFAAISWNQISTWRDGITLWKHAIECTGGSWMAYNHLGRLLRSQNRHNEAILFFATKRKQSNDASTIADLNTQLGLISLETGRVAEAESDFREAVRKEPMHELAHYHLGEICLRRGDAAEAAEHFRLHLELDPQSSQAHNLLGLALLDLRSPAEAIKELQQAVVLTPEVAVIHFNLGSACQAAEDWTNATASYRRAVELQPENARYLRTLAYSLSRQGQTTEARDAYQRSLRLDPNWPRALTQKAWQWATHPDPRRRKTHDALGAIEQVREAMGADDPSVLDVAAAVYAANGRFADARAVARRAIVQASAAGAQNLAKEIESHLNLYEKDRPFSKTVP